MTTSQKIRASLFLLCIALTSGCCGAGGGDAGPGPVSQSGSTAAMLIHRNAMYVLDHYILKVFDISEGVNPRLVEEIPLSAPETLFIHEDHLYIGGATAVAIWDISDPLNPLDVTIYQHLRGCDPVVVEDATGYVTLRGHHTCNSNENRLEIIDFSDPANPEKISHYPMAFPHGLAKTPDFLAVCQEHYGLSLLDVEDPHRVVEIAKYPGILCFDAIFSRNNLILTATDGIYQFEASDRYLDQLSVIPVGQPR